MKNIVTIGGGTGSFTLLSGLKKYPVDITAIVTMADDGGSTGRLRDELGVLPPGDVRQCLVALSDSSELLRELMNYRFERGGLKGHNFGNLLLSALEKIKGNFSGGVEEAAKILRVKGKVVPVSEEKMNLHIKLKNKQVVKGENQLDHNKDVRKYGIDKIYLRPNAKAYKKSIEAIKEADMVIIGPGDHYGSIIPNILVKGIPEALQKTKAMVVYVCNLTNKKGQTERFNLDDYAEAINGYIRKDRIDYVISSTKNPDEELIKVYEKKEGKGSLVMFDNKKEDKRGYKIVRANVLCKKRTSRNKNDSIASARSFIRHDSDKLAKVLIELLEIKNRKLIKKII